MLSNRVDCIQSEIIEFVRIQAVQGEGSGSKSDFPKIFTIFPFVQVLPLIRRIRNQINRGVVSTSRGDFIGNLKSVRSNQLSRCQSDLGQSRKNGKIVSLKGLRTIAVNGPKGSVILTGSRRGSGQIPIAWIENQSRRKTGSHEGRRTARSGGGGGKVRKGLFRINREGRG